MPKKLVDVLKSFAQKAGVQLTDAFNQELTALGDQVVLSDEFVQGIDRGLISMTEAKNNHPDIVNHYRATILNGVNERVKAIMDDFAIPDEARKVIDAEQNSYKKVDLLAKHVRETEKKTATSNQDKDKQTLTQQITDLQGQLAVSKTEKEGMAKRNQEEIASIKTQVKKESLFAGYKTVFDSMPAAARTAALNALVDEFLNTKNATIVTDESGNLVLKSRDGAGVFTENHQPLDPKGMMDTVFGNAKVLVVNDGGKDSKDQKNQQQQQQNQQQQNSQNSQRQNANQNQQNSQNNGNGSQNQGGAIQSMIEKSISEYETASARPFGS